MAIDVFGVGNALVDIQVHVTEQMLEDLGFEKGIMTLVDAATQKRVLDFVQSHSTAGNPVSRSAGGSAANTIMGIADFGGQAAYCGQVGQDDLGKFFLQDMRTGRVRIESPQKLGQTGTCVILITPDAQRTMLTNLALSANLGAGDINQHELAGSKYVYVEGYLFGGEPTYSAAMHAITTAKKAGCKVAFTVSDPFLIKNHRDLFWELIQGPVDLLFCNLEEARALTGLEFPINCAQAIHRHAENVALTLGAEGSILMNEGQVIPIEGRTVDAVDTTGAGDMYAAGILYGVTNGLTWKESGRLASLAASRVVAQMGARLKQKLTPEEVQSIRG